MRSFPNLQIVAASNANGAMVEVLAKELGVSAKALIALHVGYFPHIEFKKGSNYDGHWTFPERDSSGAITGLSLRNRRDGRRKPMFPGSKHGLFFAPSTTATGETGNSGGGLRWLRVNEAGVDCPICGKPDWCMVSGPDPLDPAAAICPRTPSDQDYGEAGPLHILDPVRYERLIGASTSTHILPASRFPVVVVEGATDTAALLGLGLVAVGRPSADGGLTPLAGLLRGRSDVVILGENDEKTDGSWPGKYGAEKTLKALGPVCPKVRVVFPPADYKDVREWISLAGLSLEAFIEHVDKYAGTKITDRPVADTLSDDNTSTVAGALLERVYTADDRPTLLHCQESWYDYGAGGWREEATRHRVSGEIHRFLARTKFKKVDRRSNTVTLDAFDPTVRLVKNIHDHLRAVVPNPVLPPVWLDGRAGPLPERLLCFKNGTLDMEDFVRGDLTVTPYTSDLFTTARLPFGYEVGATCPQWDQWLQSTLGDDRRKIVLLQEWFGYNLIPDTSHEKMMLMHGPTRSGKSTALEILRTLLGPDAYAASTLKSFASSFGLHSLIGKLACIMPDAIAPEHNRTECLQTLLELVGNDSVQVNRKFKTALSCQMKARVTMACNQMPNLPDTSLALDARLLFLTFTTSFLGREDFGLKDRLKTEMSGIALWALAGLKRLHENGEFTLPGDASQMHTDFRNLTCPIADFADTWVFVNKDAVLTLTALYEAWKMYTEERSMHRRSMEWLFQQLKVRFPHIGRTNTVIDGHTVKQVTGLDLHDFTANAARHRRTG